MILSGICYIIDKSLYIGICYIIDNMRVKQVMISVQPEDYEFLKEHPELNRSELFRIAVKQYKKEHFEEVKE